MKIPPDIDDTGWYKGKSVEAWDQAELRAEQQAIQLKQEFVGTGKSVVCTVHGDLIGGIGSINPLYPLNQ